MIIKVDIKYPFLVSHFLISKECIQTKSAYAHKYTLNLATLQASSQNLSISLKTPTIPL